MGSTESLIIFTVLQSALLTQNIWGIELRIAEHLQNIDMVRVTDDRADICAGGDLPDQPADQAYLPLSPTAFGNEAPPKWGFVFSVGSKCREYKGISLDVYAVVERARRNKKSVVLTLKDDRIIGAR